MKEEKHFQLRSTELKEKKEEKLIHKSKSTQKRVENEIAMCRFTQRHDGGTIIIRGR